MQHTGFKSTDKGEKTIKNVSWVSLALVKANMLQCVLRQGSRTSHCVSPHQCLSSTANASLFCSRRRRLSVSQPDDLRRPFQDDALGLLQVSLSAE